jgi:[acyl-carrier-protein] S-malonyltransferase
MKPAFAFVFPGQGAQSVGMLDAFAASAAAHAVLEEASDTLGQNIGQLIAEGPGEQLDLTVNTQPAILTAAYAIYRVWCERGGLPPTLVTGHSLGEYTALVVAGALTFHDALLLVRFRAQAMQEAVPLGTGAMAAIIGLNLADVQTVCAQLQPIGIVEAVNFNTDLQHVIAGHRTAVNAACEQALAIGAKRAVLLAVSAPFHSSLLATVSAQLRNYLSRIDMQSPAIAVINNVDAAIYTNPDEIRDALARQASQPVRWVECVQAIAETGIKQVVECGPGKVLSGLIKRIDSTLATTALSDLNAFDRLLTQLSILPDKATI